MNLGEAARRGRRGEGWAKTTALTSGRAHRGKTESRGYRWVGVISNRVVKWSTSLILQVCGVHAADDARFDGLRDPSLVKAERRFMSKSGPLVRMTIRTLVRWARICMPVVEP